MKKPKAQPDTDESLDQSTDPERFTKAQYAKALGKLDGKDAVGRAGELLTTVGGVAAGASASGAIAAAVGATTLLGSGTLAGVLGGVFVTATPIGWIAGSAAAGGVAAYAVAQLIRSGTRQDEIRGRLAGSIKQKIAAMNWRKTSQLDDTDPQRKLVQKIAQAVRTGLLSEDAASRMLVLVDKNALNTEIALDRIDRILNHSKT